MNHSELRLEGWYPDETNGGTRYWDGQRWTSAWRPPRRTFAAKAKHTGWGIALSIYGGLYTIMFLFGSGVFFRSWSGVGSFLFGLAFHVGILLLGIYLLRGQGPTTKAVLAQLRAVPRETPAPMVVAAPAPQMLSGDCSSCGAPIQGPSGQVITCSYCNSPQSIPAR